MCIFGSSDCSCVTFLASEPGLGWAASDAKTLISLVISSFVLGLETLCVVTAGGFLFVLLMLCRKHEQVDWRRNPSDTRTHHHDSVAAEPESADPLRLEARDSGAGKQNSKSEDRG